MLYFFDKSIRPPFQPSFLPFLLLVLAPFSSPSVWGNWSARMEWYQPTDRVIRLPLHPPFPPFPTLLSPHFWHINKISGLFVSIHHSVSSEKRIWCTGARMELPGDERELRVGWLPSLTVHRHPTKSPKLFRRAHFLEWRSQIVKNGIRKIMCPRLHTHTQYMSSYSHLNYRTSIYCIQKWEGMREKFTNFVMLLR